MKSDSDFSTPAPVFHPANSIPVELRSLPQWVCWHYTERNGKRTKPPIDPKSNGKLLNAKSNDPATWSDFDTAVATAERLNLAGVGLVLSETDGLTGLDLDHVFDPETGELDSLAVEVLDRFAGTYTEISPSGSGIRIWCYGKPQRSGKCVGKVKWLEVYSHPSNRYLTVTGHHWPGSSTFVTDQQTALDWLHSRFMQDSTGRGEAPTEKPRSPSVESCLTDDDILLTKARQASNGAVFDALWAGDLSGYGDDHSSADLALCNLLAFWTNSDPARIDRLFRQSGLMREKWDTVHDPATGRTYGGMTIDKAIAGCKGGYSSQQRKGQAPGYSRPVEPVRAELAGIEPADAGLNPYRGTDDANADLLLRLHGADIRYCPPWDQWLIWRGSHWQMDERLDIDRLAADVSRSLRSVAITQTQQQQALLARMAELLTAINRAPGTSTALTTEHGQLAKQQAAIGDEVDWLLKLAGKLEGTAKRGTMLLAARHKVVVHHSDLDQGHYLLNVRNGTLDLHTGAMRPHERLDLLTHDTAIEYDPTAQCPLWLAFLAVVLDHDAELICFVQRAVGYSLTGDVREQVLLILTGVGSNGKSVFLNVLRKLLGRLAIQAAPDLLMVKRSEQHPTDQADLFGKRLVVCQETEDGRRLNESLVKQLTGGDGIRARRMREDFWEFNPTHKIWLSTNHKPEIRGTDHAIWRRIRIIPFNVKFHEPGEGTPVKDTAMEAKLTAELPGILNWAIQGCLDWQRHGLKAPAMVKAATEGYRQEMDVLAVWIADCCVVKERCETKAADLYASYTAWCEQSGEHAEKQRKFGMRLKERGFENFLSTGGYSKWKGIGLRIVDLVDEVDEVSVSPPRENQKMHESGYRKSSSTRSTSSTELPDNTPAPCPVDSPQPPLTPPQHTVMAAIRAAGLYGETLARIATACPKLGGGLVKLTIAELIEKGRIVERDGRYIAAEVTRKKYPPPISPPLNFL
jgi:putative DNA primase/helicase